MKNIKTLFGILLVFGLMGCNSKAPQPKVSPEAQKVGFQIYPTHKTFVSGLINGSSNISQKEAPKGNSYQGKWIFTILKKDRKLLPGMVVRKTSFHGTKVITGDKVDPASIPSEAVVYAGFMSLDANGGYDIISNAANSKQALEAFKVDGNKLKWSLIYKPDGKSKLFNQKMLFHTDAVYDPISDSIKGVTSFGMQMIFVEGDQNGKKVAYRKSLIPMGVYTWQATRLSDNAFDELTKEGSFNANLPQYSVGLDTTDKNIQKYMFAKK